MDDVLGCGSRSQDSSPVPAVKPGLSEDEFKLVQMTIKDADDKGRVLWQVEDWNISSPETEQAVQFPKEMLDVKVLAREIVFYSKHKYENFSIAQVMSVGGQVIERLEFKFGFVIPGSTNSWE